MRLESLLGIKSFVYLFVLPLTGSLASGEKHGVTCMEESDFYFNFFTFSPGANYAFFIGLNYDPRQIIRNKNQ